MRTILVSGASGIVGYGILRTLRNSGLTLNLIGSSIYDDSVAPAFCDIFELAPKTTAPEYMEWLLEMLRKHQIDMIIPGIEIDMQVWRQHSEQIRQTGTVPLLNTSGLIDLCRDKWHFYEHLCTVYPQCAIDSTLDNQFDVLAQRFGLPFLLKPRRGFGAKGIQRIRDEAHFAAHREHIGPVLMAQPIVGSDEEEFTVSVFADGTGGFHAGMAMRRKLSVNGFTEKAEVLSIAEFNGTITELCKHLRPIGPTNFQFRKHNGALKLLEINPRISSSTSIRAAFGYNESAMSVNYYLHQITPIQPVIRYGNAIRYTDEYIFYEDRIHL